MGEKYLHIITHDVPWPADYGGVVDLFYKMKTLHQAGVKIHLHCFVNKRPPQDELKINLGTTRAVYDSQAVSFSFTHRRANERFYPKRAV